MIKSGIKIFDQKTIEGWAINTDSPKDHLFLSVFVDDVFDSKVVLNLPRPDVASKFGGSGLCGFRTVLSRPLKWKSVISLQVDDTGEQVGKIFAPAMPSQQEYNTVYKLYDTDVGPLLLNNNDINLDAKIIRNKCWSPDEQLVMKRLLETSTGDFFDVGANMGFCSVAAANYLARDRQILAFEPQESVFKRLCANLVLNNVHNARPIRSLLWSVPGADVEIELIDPLWPGASGGARAIAAETSIYSAPVETIDRWASDRQVSLIKIDCEGAELEILKGAVNTLESQRPFLYFECNVIQQSREILSMLFGLNYVLYWHAPLVDAVTPRKLTSVESANCSLNVIALPVEQSNALKLLDDINQIKPIRSPEEYWPIEKVGRDIHRKAVAQV